MKKKEYLTSQPISIRFPKGQIEHLKQIARERSANQKEDIAYSDLIRDAVEMAYPMRKK